MDGESIRQETYMAYMLRLWQAGSRDGKSVWRASLENPHTGERLAFGDAKDLFAFLAKLMAHPDDMSARGTQSEPAIIRVANSSTVGED
jgi:hypothetical protein